MSKFLVPTTRECIVSIPLQRLALSPPQVKKERKKWFFLCSCSFPDSRHTLRRKQSKRVSQKIKEALIIACLSKSKTGNRIVVDTLEMSYLRKKAITKKDRGTKQDPRKEK